MGAIECPCGQHLEAPGDDELVRLCREHVEREHPAMRIGTQIGEHFAEHRATLAVGEPFARG